jgi:hypothetical protein
MNEHEPIAEKQQKIERAAKLRAMKQTSGWTEVFEPDLRRGIAEQKEIVATTEYKDLLALRLDQARIKFAEEILNTVDIAIKEGEETQKEEIAKEHKDSPEA